MARYQHFLRGDGEIDIRPRTLTATYPPALVDDADGPSESPATPVVADPGWPPNTPVVDRH